MNKNEYKVNTYVLIKNGEIYEIDEEGLSLIHISEPTRP